MSSRYFGCAAIEHWPCTKVIHWSAAALDTFGWQCPVFNNNEEGFPDLFLEPTESDHTNSCREIEHFSAIAKFDVGALARGHHDIVAQEATDAFGDLRGVLDQTRHSTRIRKPRSKLKSSTGENHDGSRRAGAIAIQLEIKQNPNRSTSAVTHKC